MRQKLLIEEKNGLKPAYKADKGVLRKYIATVKSASEGCVTDEF